MEYLFKFHRKKRGWTIDQLADVSGLSRGFISQLETGQRQPSAETITTLAEIYNVTPVELIDAGDMNADLLQLYEIMRDLSAEDRRALVRSAVGLRNAPKEEDQPARPDAVAPPKP
jgi:transcriptional regulator with XRE-family HTH domain